MNVSFTSVCALYSHVYYMYDNYNLVFLVLCAVVYILTAADNKNIFESPRRIYILHLKNNN